MNLLPLLRQMLAMTDHDRQLPQVGHTKYGEAVGIVPQDRMAARPRLLRFAVSQLRLFGQYFHETMATPMRRSGSEDLTQ